MAVTAQLINNKTFASVIAQSLVHFHSGEYLLTLIPDDKRKEIISKAIRTLTTDTMASLLTDFVNCSLQEPILLSGPDTHIVSEPTVEPTPPVQLVESPSSASVVHKTRAQWSKLYHRNKHQIAMECTSLVDSRPLYPSVCSKTNCNLCLSWYVTTALSPCLKCPRKCTSIGWYPHLRDANIMKTAHANKHTIHVDKRVKEHEIYEFSCLMTIPTRTGNKRLECLTNVLCDMQEQKDERVVEKRQQTTNTKGVEQGCDNVTTRSAVKRAGSQSSSSRGRINHRKRMAKQDVEGLSDAELSAATISDADWIEALRKDSDQLALYEGSSRDGEDSENMVEEAS